MALPLAALAGTGGWVQASSLALALVVALLAAVLLAVLRRQVAQHRLLARVFAWGVVGLAGLAAVELVELALLALLPEAMGAARIVGALVVGGLAGLVASRRATLEQALYRLTRADEWQQNIGAQLALVMSNTSDLVMLLDAPGTYRYASPSHVAALGWDHEALFGHDLLRYVHPDDAAWLDWPTLLRDGRGSASYRHRRVDGSYAQIAATWRVVRNNGAAQVVCIGRDASADEQRDASLRFVTGHARAILWAGMVYDTDPAGQHLVWDTDVFSREAAQAVMPLALKPGERYTAAWYRYRLPADQAVTDAKARQAFRGGWRDYESVFRCRGADGEIRWFTERVHLDPIKAHRWRVVGVAVEITAQKRAEGELVDAYDATLEGWARALELRDHETEGHSRRVIAGTVELAKQFGISGEALLHVRRGALLHDIGKLAVPDAVLRKPGKLTAEEWLVMKLHPVYADQLLRPIAYLAPALPIPRWHHEHWDGTGYPDGLAGEQIPLEARIFSVIDAYDAMTSDRVYRAAMTTDEAVGQLRDKRGAFFDPQVVDVFVRQLWRERGG